MIDDAVIYEYEDGARITLSIEQHQDMEMKTRHMSRIIRMSKPFTDAEIAEWNRMMQDPGHAGMIFTDEPPDAEIAEWREAWSVLKDMDFAEVRKRYKIEFVRDEYCEPPYQEPEYFNFENTGLKSWCSNNTMDDLLRFFNRHA
mgnify:CR=1 FL=1